MNKATIQDQVCCYLFYFSHLHCQIYYLSCLTVKIESPGDIDSLHIEKNRYKRVIDKKLQAPSSFARYGSDGWATTQNTFKFLCHKSLGSDGEPVCDYLPTCFCFFYLTNCKIEYQGSTVQLGSCRAVHQS